MKLKDTKPVELSRIGVADVWQPRWVGSLVELAAEAATRECKERRRERATISSSREKRAAVCQKFVNVNIK